jgi:hypothetical protein
MATNLVDISNPILHAAKALNHTGVPALAPAKDALFKLFALVFLVVRVIAMPPAVVWPCWRDGVVMPVHWYVPLATFMTVVQLLQFFWFYKIVRIALGGGSDDREPTPGIAKPAGAVAVANGHADAKPKAA